MKIKTSELIGRQLDSAVALAHGWELENYGWWKIDRGPNGGQLCYSQGRVGEFSPSTNWAQGGPLIERECIELVPSLGGSLWYAESIDRKARAEACPTPLIAAMRCLVASRLGDEVDIPEELT